MFKKKKFQVLFPVISCYFRMFFVNIVKIFTV